MSGTAAMRDEHGRTISRRGDPLPLSVGVAELRRAWAAAAAGQFRNPAGAGSAHVPPAASSWAPSAGERVHWVVGCAGSSGASTVALALASAATGHTRVVECCTPTASGLAAASTAELGAPSAAWLAGSRGDLVMIQRPSAAVRGPSEVPVPPPAGRATTTIIDVGWTIGQLAGTSCWLAGALTDRAVVVAVTVATVPGLRRLEAVLPLLGGSVTAAVVGPDMRRWPAVLLGSRGAGMQRLQDAGRLVVVPHDRRLALRGLGSSPLPRPVLEAAAEVLRTAFTPGVATGRPS